MVPHTHPGGAGFRGLETYIFAQVDIVRWPHSETEAKGSPGTQIQMNPDGRRCVYERGRERKSKMEWSLEDGRAKERRRRAEQSIYMRGQALREAASPNPDEMTPPSSNKRLLFIEVSRHPPVQSVVCDLNGAKIFNERSSTIR